MSLTPTLNPAWIGEARACLMGEFGLPHGLATAAATALLQREIAHRRVRSPVAVVWEHMDSPEPPIVDPDGDYGDGLTIRLGPG